MVAERHGGGGIDGGRESPRRAASLRFGEPAGCGRITNRKIWPRREAFARDPRLVWEWYNWRREAIKQAKPNAGHAALVRLEIQKPHFTLITQNVDGLHDYGGQRPRY